jgi:hypothetical protein
MVHAKSILSVAAETAWALGTSMLAGRGQGTDFLIAVQLPALWSVSRSHGWWPRAAHTGLIRTRFYSRAGRGGPAFSWRPRMARGSGPSARTSSWNCRGSRVPRSSLPSMVADYQEWCPTLARYSFHTRDLVSRQQPRSWRFMAKGER